MKKIMILIFFYALDLHSEVEIVFRSMPLAVIDTALSYRNLIDVGGKKTDANIQRFLKSVGLKGNQPYCQAFVYYCHAVNDYTEFKTGLANGYYTSLKNKYGSAKGKITDKKGLIVWKYNNSSRGHIGFILGSPRVGYVLTLEGNTSWDDSSPDGRVYAGKKGIFIKQRKIGILKRCRLV